LISNGGRSEVRRGGTVSFRSTIHYYTLFDCLRSCKETLYRVGERGEDKQRGVGVKKGGKKTRISSVEWV
jgi:hypothetical protein